MIILNLFFVFFKIGLVNFGGGNAIAPIIQKDIVISKKWITDEEFINIMTVSRITPGPVAINMATYIGAKRAGVIGAVVATVSVVLGPILIMLLILLILHKVNFLKYYFENLNPIIIALWIITIIILFQSIFFKIGTDSIELLKSFSLAALNLIILLFYRKINTALLIIFSGLLYTIM